MKGGFIFGLLVVATLIVSCGSTTEPIDEATGPAEVAPEPAAPDSDEPLAAEELSGTGIDEKELEEIDDILAELDDLDLTLDEDLAALDAALE